MANYFVDSTTGSDSDNGTTMDLAWATFEHAVVSGGMTAADTLWVRRIHVEAALSANVVGACDGTPSNPVRLSGWPRASDSATSATWVNGSTTVDLVVGISLDREQHLGRYVTAPDGETYMITLVTDADTFTIDREYASPNASAAAGAFTVQADENYATAQAIDDSGWTIDVAAWTADADDIATVLVSGGAYFYRPGRYNFHSNLEFVSSQAKELVGQSDGVTSFYQGCLFKHTGNDRCLETGYQTTSVLDRCVMTGAGSSNGYNDAILMSTYGAAIVKNTVIYDMGNHGIYLAHTGQIELENVNIGIEGINYDDDIVAGNYSKVTGRDVKLGGTNGDVAYILPGPATEVAFENFNKILGAHKTFTGQGTIVKTDVVAGSGDPYKRPGGADSVMEVAFNTATATHTFTAPVPEIAYPIFTHEFEATTDTKNYRYYVQAEGIVAASELWLECEYISVFDDTSEYVITKVTSDEAFTARADAEDWAEYLEVTGIEPAVASKVRIKCYCSYYHATNKIYIDPKVVITDG